MPEFVCEECGGPVVQKGPGRAKQFCSRKCFRTNYRKRVVDKTPIPSVAVCVLCKHSFEPTKRHQRFCSRLCYTRAWQLDREKHNAIQNQKRADKPEWFREHEPKYYRTHRTNKLKIQPWAYTLKSRRYAAKAENTQFTLDDAWAESRWINCCEVSGLPFTPSRFGSGPNPFSVTIDKIDPKKGYVPDNCRFVLMGVNALKGSGTDEDMYKIAEAIMLKRTSSLSLEAALALPG